MKELTKVKFTRSIKGTLGRVEKDRTHDIKRWAEKIKNYLDDSIEVFGYFGKFYSGHPPTDVKKFLNLLSGEKSLEFSTLDRFINT